MRCTTGPSHRNHSGFSLVSSEADRTAFRQQKVGGIGSFFLLSLRLVKEITRGETSLTSRNRYLQRFGKNRVAYPCTTGEIYTQRETYTEIKGGG